MVSLTNSKCWTLAEQMFARNESNTCDTTPISATGSLPNQSHCHTIDKRCACWNVEITARVDSAP